MIVLVSLIVLLRGFPCFHDFSHGASLHPYSLFIQLNDFYTCVLYNHRIPPEAALKKKLSQVSCCVVFVLLCLLSHMFIMYVYNHVLCISTFVYIQIIYMYMYVHMPLQLVSKVSSHQKEVKDKAVQRKIEQMKKKLKAKTEL